MRIIAKMWDECPHPDVAKGAAWSEVADVLSVNPIDPFLVAALSHQIITIGGVRVWWSGLAIRRPRVTRDMSGLTKTRS